MSNERPTAERLLVHGTTVALGAAAAILRGPPGAGKSDLALRFLAGGGRWPNAGSARALVADDQTWLTLDAGRLMASAPPTIAGRIEVRGVGITRVAPSPPVAVRLVIDLVQASQIERLPEATDVVDLLGCQVPLRRLYPFEESAALKLTLLLAAALR